MKVLYVLHSTVGLERGRGGTVRHYTGITDSTRLAERLLEHSQGHGSALTRAFRRAGGSLLLVRIIPNSDRWEERHRKESRHTDELCPLCRDAARMRDKISRVRAKARRNGQPLTLFDMALRANGGASPLPNSTIATLSAGVSHPAHPQGSGIGSPETADETDPGGPFSPAPAQPSGPASSISAGTKPPSTSGS